jgi:cell division protein FtsW
MAKQQPAHIDWLILLPIAALLLFSVAFVYSASASFAADKFGSSEQLFWNHAIRVLIGLLLIVGVSRIDYHMWQRVAPTIVLVAIGFLVLVFLRGNEIKGAARWVSIGPLNFQPSELAKFAIVLNTASMLSMPNVLTSWRTSIVPVLIWSVPVCVLIALQPNVSTASVVFFLAMVQLFLAGAPMRALALVIASGGALACAYALTAEYRVRRIMSFLGGGSGDDAIRYQVHQAMIAFGNGGITGLGPGQSRQRDFLPESYGDFIFSIVGEEYGFLGVLLLLSLFLAITWRGFLVARKAPDLFGKLLAAGITITLGVYAAVNAGVNCGVLPTTGLPMPFISYGGSSVFFSAIAVGVLLNISSQAGVYKRKTTATPL